MNDSIIFSSQDIDFGTVFITGHPISKEIEIQNNFSKPISLIFSGQNDNFFLVKSRKRNEAQSSSKFDIFSLFPKISNLIIKAHHSQIISLVENIPSKEWENASPIEGAIHANAYLIDADLSDENESIDDEFDEEIEFEPLEGEEPFQEYDITYKVNPVKPTLEFLPSVTLLDDCCKDHPISTTFEVRNTNEIPITLLSYIPPEIKIECQTKDINYFTLEPEEKAVLEVTYFPTHTGEFDLKIDFATSNAFLPPFTHRILTIVSPAKLPLDFPTISPNVLQFGSLRANDTKELSFIITNPSNDDYTINISSYSECEAQSEPLGFKTALKSQFEKTTTITLAAQSIRTVFVSYTPYFNHHVSHGAIEKRSFVMAMMFTLSNQDANFYRRVPVIANVCHSYVTVHPSSINFGDMLVSSEPKHSSIVISNQSNMPTSVTVMSPYKWIALSQTRVELQAKEVFEYEFSFVPYKISPDFQCPIIVTNDWNQENKKEIQVSAAVLDNSDEVTHSSFYQLVSDQKVVHSLDFSFVSANFPAIKQLSIRNTSKSDITISIHASSKQVKVYEEYFDDASNEMLKTMSLSSISASSQSSEFTLSTPNLFTEQQDQEAPSMLKLEAMMHKNPQFFNNMFLYGLEKSEEELVEMYESQLQSYNAALNNTLLNRLDMPITIKAGQKEHLWVILTPDAPKTTLLWTAQRQELSFKLHIDPVPPPHVLPITYNVASSCTFITAHNLNYGTLVRKTTKESHIFLMNESTLPLLYRLQMDTANNYVTVMKNQVGIVPPLDNRVIPIKFETPVEGKVCETINIKNVLNPKEKQVIRVKAVVERRAGFFVDPLEIDFGQVTFGTSVKVPIYIKNIREEDAMYTFAHYHRDVPTCKPMISFQYQNMSESHLTATVEAQIESRTRKMLICERKKRYEKAEKIRKQIEQLKKTSQTTESAQKRSTAKSIDRCELQSGKLQTHCLLVEFIPSLKKNIGFHSPVKIEGFITINEENRANSNKSIKYKAYVVPQKLHLIDEAGDNTIRISKDHIDLGTIFVQTVVSTQIEITNISKTNSTPFWVSAESTDETIFTFGVNEGNLAPGQKITIPIDLFVTHVKERTKAVTITTPTSSTSCKIHFEAIYQNVVSFPSLPLNKVIDFGSMPLTSLTTVEERKSFDIVNVSDKQIFLCVNNLETRHVVLYEHDPDFPIMNTITLEPTKLIRINIRLKPDIDLTSFKKYSTFVLNDSITVQAFFDPDDAANASLHKQEGTGCIYQAQIPIKALIGRVGLSFSDKFIDFGSVTKTPQVAKISIRNKSSRIPLDVFCGCSQGLTVDSPRFTIPGQKDNKEPKDIEITFKPTVEGLNTGKLLFTVASTSLQFEVEVFAFVDPHHLEAQLPRNERGYYYLDLGEVYLNGDKPIQKRVSFHLKNVSQILMTGDISEINKSFYIRPGITSEISFMAPPLQDSEEYERAFTFPIHFRGKMTKAIQQIVEISGRYIISSGQATSSVELGTIITSESTINTTLDFNVLNNVRADLYLDLVKGTPFFDIPKTIGPVESMDAVAIKAKAIPGAMRQFTGDQNFSIVYVNRNNSSNVITIPVTMKLLPSLITTDFGNTLTITKFKEVSTEKEKVWTNSLFFSIGNALDDETTVNIEVRENLPQQVHLEILKRSAEAKLDSLTLQAADLIEIRLKATIVGENYPSEEMVNNTKLGTIVFSNESYPPFLIDVMFSPEVVEVTENE